MTFKVMFSEAASQDIEEDLEELFDFSLQRGLDSDTADLDVPARALQAVKGGIAWLAVSPFACRKAGSSPFQRELVIPLGRTGCVALFEIVDGETVIVGAVRHQREDDYH